MYEGISRQTGTCDMVKYIIHIFAIVIFLGCLICKCAGKFKELNDIVFHTGHGMGNDSFKD